MAITRRQVLRRAASGAPTIVAAATLGHAARAAPSNRVAVGLVGCGKMANDYHLPQLLGQPDVQLVGICEVDRTRREHAVRRIEDAYSNAKRTFKGVQQTFDFRELISRPDIDAVCIATPDHWHATPLIEACKAGKDVYCEKPLTLTIAEAQRCVQAARKFRRVVQTGSQQRSNVFGQFRQAVEIIRNGRLGAIRRVTVGVGAPSVACDLPAQPVEKGLAWDMWLGQAPFRDYHSILSPRGVHNHFPAWRNYREYSGGGHTDMGAHHYDIAHWALNMDHSGPVKITPPADPEATTGVRYLYANGTEIQHGGPSGCVFHGEHGTLRIDRGVLQSNPPELATEPLGSNALRLPVSPGHHRNWLNCIQNRKRPVADVEYGARTATVVHLGNLAYAYRRTLDWDPATWRFEAAADNPLLDRPRRDPWQLPQL